MITLGSLGFTCLTLNTRLLQCFLNSKLWFELNSMLPSNLFNLIRVWNICLSPNCLSLKVSFIEFYVHIPYNKMVGLPLLAHAHMPPNYWPFSFRIASYLINRLPTPILAHESSYHLLYHISPSYSPLEIFGYFCFPFSRSFNDNKLQFWSHECVFIGYDSQYKVYLCLNHTLGRIYISRHVMFYEHIFPFSNIHSPSSCTTYPSSPIIVPIFFPLLFIFPFPSLTLYLLSYHFLLHLVPHLPSLYLYHLLIPLL